MAAIACYAALLLLLFSAVSPQDVAAQGGGGGGAGGGNDGGQAGGDREKAGNRRDSDDGVGENGNRGARDDGGDDYDDAPPPKKERRAGSLRTDGSAAEPRVVAAHQARIGEGIVGVTISPAVAVVAPGDRIRFTVFGADASGERVDLGDASCIWLRARSGGDLDDEGGRRDGCSQTYRAGSVPGADRVIHVAVTLEDGTTVAAEAFIQLAVPAEAEPEDGSRPRYRAWLDYLEPGSPIPVVLPPQAPVALITLDASAPSLGQVQVTVDELDGLPPDVPPPGGTIHELVEISAGSAAGPQGLQGASLVFRVWSAAAEAGCPPASCGIRIRHFANGAWETLEALFVGTQNGASLFESPTSSFSPFAILFDVTAAGQDGRIAGGTSAELDLALRHQMVEAVAALSEAAPQSSDVNPHFLPPLPSASVEAGASAVILLLVFFVGAAPSLALKADGLTSPFPRMVGAQAGILLRKAKTGARGVSRRAAARAKKATARARRTAARAKPVLKRTAGRALRRMRSLRVRRGDEFGPGSNEGDFGSLY